MDSESSPTSRRRRSANLAVRVVRWLLAYDESYMGSLKPVADRLSALLNRKVVMAGDCIGEAAKTAVLAAGEGSRIALLENLRFHAEEEKNDPAFAKALSELADVYVDDAFGAAHRAHASVAGMVSYFSRPQDLKTSRPQDLKTSDTALLETSAIAPF